MWSQLEPTPPHITFLVLPIFLILFALFCRLIRDRLHLSEPPLAVLYGILLGPALLGVLAPRAGWGLNDSFTQEFTRLVLGIQCFAIGIDLPPLWLNHRAHRASVLWLLGPVMTYSWAVTAVFAYVIFNISWPAAAIIGACLSPTDPVLAAGVLRASTLSKRVPARLRDLLAAESACNDGTSFPFLYAGLFVLERRTAAAAARDWLLVTILYQCALGLLAGYVLGRAANRLLRSSERRGYASRPSLVVFYLLLAVLSVGIGSTLGLDDFLVAFGAGIGFAHDGWFSSKAEEAQGDVPFRHVVDLVLDSTVFVYFGSTIPWASFVPGSSEVLHGHISVGRLALFLVLVLLFRRIPVALALQAWRLIPDVRTYNEALFCGHFGPMGVGALFLSIEARAQLETGTSTPFPKPRPPVGPPYDDTDVAKALVWPVVCFVVLGSTMVHGLSGLVMSLGSHLGREGERVPLLGGESEGLAGIDQNEEGGLAEDGVGNVAHVSEHGSMGS